MRENAKSLQKNTGEFEGILIGPSKAPRFFEPVELLRGGFFDHWLEQNRLRVKFCGADGEPTNETLGGKINGAIFSANSRSGRWVNRR